jgi:Holliday junction resolvasome RuvABC endonuclease subunit
MNVLGIDCSTSTIGITILDEHENLILIDYIKPQGDNLFEKMESASKQIDEKIKLIPIHKIYAEQPNIMFSRGLSSAQVIATILRFNGAILFTLSQKYNILINEAMASSMRKKIIGIGRFPKGTNTKQEIFNWVQKNSLQKINWPLMEKGKNKGKFKNECFDMADSYITALYGVDQENDKVLIRCAERIKTL